MGTMWLYTPAGGGGGTAVSDNFNRTNSTGLGANWGTPTGMTSFNISSNMASRSGSDSGNYWSANTFADNQYAEANGLTCGTVPFSVPNTHPYSGAPAVRMATGDQTYYCAPLYYWDDQGGSSGWQLELFKRVAGTYTRLAAYDATAFATSTTVVRIKANGTTISVETASSHGGTYTQRISVTDSAIASGAAGIIGGTVNTSFGADNWYGGDL